MISLRDDIIRFSVCLKYYILLQVGFHTFYNFLEM